jgi:hypothetical protein
LNLSLLNLSLASGLRLNNADTYDAFARELYEKLYALWESAIPITEEDDLKPFSAGPPPAPQVPTTGVECAMPMGKRP